MNSFVKVLFLSIMLSITAIASAQKTEYTVHNLKGSVEYKLKQADGWQPVKRLMSLPKSSFLKIADGAELTVYSTSNPQPLRLTLAGENKLRTLINDAEAKSAKTRGSKITQIFNGQGKPGVIMPAGTSYRGQDDDTILVDLYNAMLSPMPVGNAPVSLSLINGGDGDFNVELSNNSDIDLAVAVIINVSGNYSDINISGDPSNMGMLVLPAGVTMIVPECSLIGIEGMKVYAVASPEPFSPETLCVLLNSEARGEKPNGSDSRAVAVEASIK